MQDGKGQIEDSTRRYFDSVRRSNGPARGSGARLSAVFARMDCDRTEGEKFLPRGGASIAPRRTLTRSSEKSRGKRASYIRGGSFPDARTPDGAYAAPSRCPPTRRPANPLRSPKQPNSE